MLYKQFVFTAGHTLPLHHYTRRIHSSHKALLKHKCRIAH